MLAEGASLLVESGCECLHWLLNAFAAVNIVKDCLTTIRTPPSSASKGHRRA